MKYRNNRAAAILLIPEMPEFCSQKFIFFRKRYWPALMAGDRVLKIKTDFALP